MSTDPIRVVDPAAVVDQGSAILVMNVYQRLMTADPGSDAPKPDAARDCMFTSATVYTCTLNTDLKFQNGHQLTSSDVKFSIERSEEHTSELQSRENLVGRLLLEKKNTN